MAEVRVDERDQANLFALILETMLEQAQANGKKLPTSGRIGLAADKMGATVDFTPQGATIYSGLRPPLEAKLSAPLATLASLGQAQYGAALTNGKIRFSGNPLALAKLAGVLLPAGPWGLGGPACPVRGKAAAVARAYARMSSKKREVK
ncbi:MAG: hypothetical protein WDA71_13750 [Actinomycetota bacterium]